MISRSVQTIFILSLVFSCFAKNAEVPSNPLLDAISADFKEVASTNNFSASPNFGFPMNISDALKITNFVEDNSNLLKAFPAEEKNMDSKSLAQLNALRLNMTHNWIQNTFPFGDLNENAPNPIKQYFQNMFPGSAAWLSKDWTSYASTHNTDVFAFWYLAQYTTVYYQQNSENGCQCGASEPSLSVLNLDEEETEIHVPIHSIKKMVVKSMDMLNPVSHLHRSKHMSSHSSSSFAQTEESSSMNRDLVNSQLKIWIKITDMFANYHFSSMEYAELMKNTQELSTSVNSKDWWGVNRQWMKVMKNRAILYWQLLRTMSNWAHVLQERSNAFSSLDVNDEKLGFPALNNFINALPLNKHLVDNTQALDQWSNFAKDFAWNLWGFNTILDLYQTINEAKDALGVMKILNQIDTLKLVVTGKWMTWIRYARFAELKKNPAAGPSFSSLQTPALGLEFAYNSFRRAHLARLISSIEEGKTEESKALGHEDYMAYWYVAEYTSQAWMLSMNSQAGGCACDQATMGSQLKFWPQRYDLFANFHLTLSQYMQLWQNYHDLRSASTQSDWTTSHRRWSAIVQNYATLNWLFWRSWSDWSVIKPASASSFAQLEEAHGHMDADKIAQIANGAQDFAWSIWAYNSLLDLNQLSKQPLNAARGLRTVQIHDGLRVIQLGKFMIYAKYLEKHQPGWSNLLKTQSSTMGIWIGYHVLRMGQAARAYTAFTQPTKTQEKAQEKTQEKTQGAKH